MGKIKISIVDKSHTDRILPIFRELEEYYFGNQAASLQEIKTYFERRVFSDISGVRVILAENTQGQVVGFATIAVLYPAPRLTGQIYMKDLFTTASHRGEGIGKSIMKFIVDYALKNNCHRVDWTAESDNPKAADFYLAIGASLIEEKQYFRFEGSALGKFLSGT